MTLAKASTTTLSTNSNVSGGLEHTKINSEDDDVTSSNEDDRPRAAPANSYELFYTINILRKEEALM